MHNTLFAQEIIFQPTFINQCNEQEEPFLYWSLYDSAELYSISIENDSTVTIPDTGTYTFHIASGRYISKIEIEINKAAHIQDTFYLYNLYYKPTPAVRYYYCDSIANGNFAEYYYNGNKRIEGSFKDGKPNDTLKTYYRSGQINEIVIPNNKQPEKICYFKDGKIKSYYSRKKHLRKKYYPNGQLSFQEKLRRGRYKQIEYFRNGNIKLKQIGKRTKEYSINKELLLRSNPRKQKSYSNNILIEEYSRKEVFKLERLRKKNKQERKWKHYQCLWKCYHANGLIKRSIRFYMSGFDCPYPSKIDQIAYNSIYEAVFYKYGSEYKKLGIDYIKENNTWEEILILHKKIGHDWVEEERYNVEEFPLLIKKLSQ